MGKINVLSRDVAELIAAGEVVERPASIVKELIENSIDAGSTAITIEIRHGGISYIRVTDNGCGIAKEDISNAFLRHATSKIAESDDLNDIGTLGFRGEALASIAAVSKVEMITKTASEVFGTKIELDTGEVQAIDEAGCSTGTTMIVRDLFFNVPARLKFMKKDTAEANVICGIVDKLAMSHLYISFKLISDQNIKLHTSGNGDLLSCIHSVYGKDFSTAMLQVEYEYNGIRVKGSISKPSGGRVNRAMQHFFVNSRYVRSKICMAALEEGYKNYMTVGKYPFCVLNVDVPFSDVDVNVHPAKIEVRFSNERAVFDAVYFAVKNTIVSNDELNAVLNPSAASFDIEPLKKDSFSNQDGEQIKLQSENNTVKYNGITEARATLSVMSSNEDYKSEIKPDVAELSEFQTLNATSFEKKSADGVLLQKPVIKLEKPLEQATAAESGKEAPKVEHEKPQSDNINIKVIGELFKTYVLFEAGEHFIMLDKHAAHERIIYDKLKASISMQDSQLLLKPVVVSLDAEEFDVLQSNVDLLCKMGFSYEEFGASTVLLREVPMLLSKYDVTDILIDIAEKLKSYKYDVSSNTYDYLLHSIACKAAIKANDDSTLEELCALVVDVCRSDGVRNCPHGRPVVTIMSKTDIEKRFGRIQ